LRRIRSLICPVHLDASLDVLPKICQIRSFLRFQGLLRALTAAIAITFALNFAVSTDRNTFHRRRAPVPLLLVSRELSCIAYAIRPTFFLCTITFTLVMAFQVCQARLLNLLISRLLCWRHIVRLWERQPQALVHGSRKCGSKLSMIGQARNCPCFGHLGHFVFQLGVYDVQSPIVRRNCCKAEQDIFAIPARSGVLLFFLESRGPLEELSDAECRRNKYLGQYYGAPRIRPGVVHRVRQFSRWPPAVNAMNPLR